MSNDIVSRKDIGTYMVQGAVGVATGIGLLVLNSFGWLPALIIGGIVTVVGWNSMTSNKTKSPFAGMIATAAGLCTLVSAIPLIGGLGAVLLTIGGIGSIVFGGLQIFKSIKGFQSRT